MKKKQNQQSLSLNKRTRSISFDKSIRLQLGSLLKISHQRMKRKIQTAKQSPYHYFGKSTRITSLNSCQNSQVLSKKTSNDKRNKDSFSKKKSKHQKKNITTQKTKANQYLIKRPKNKEPRKSSKAIGKNFEFSKLHEENRWRRALKKNFVFTNSQQVKHISRLHDVSEIGEIIKDIDMEMHSKSFLKNALRQDLKKQSLPFSKNRVLIVDWMYLIGASLSLNRQTVHLGVHYLDTYLDQVKEYDKINIVAAASMFLVVKQEQQEHKNSILQVMCMSEKIQLQKEQIIEMERKILICLNFKLKANTLSFWIDYFSLKWDKFVGKCQTQEKLKHAWPLTQYLFLLRSASGDCYKYYRELTQLADVCVLLGNYQQFQKSKLALACLYLILRIQLQKQQSQRNQQFQNIDIFSSYQREFMKKATPIFRDPLRINELFNHYLTELCQFEMTQIIPCIKFVAQFLDLTFLYAIDQKTFDESQSYEEFIRKMTYSLEMKLYSLHKAEQ